MGFKVQVVPMAWDGIIPSLLAKKIDLIYSGMTITEERKQQVDFSDVYWVVNQAIAAREGENLDIDSFKQENILLEPKEVVPQPCGSRII